MWNCLLLKRPHFWGILFQSLAMVGFPSKSSSIFLFSFTGNSFNCLFTLLKVWKRWIPKSKQNNHSLYICLQELRIISFSVVNMTERSWPFNSSKITLISNSMIWFFNGLFWLESLSFLYAIQLHCWFDEFFHKGIIAL